MPCHYKGQTRRPMSDLRGPSGSPCSRLHSRLRGQQGSALWASLLSGVGVVTARSLFWPRGHFQMGNNLKSICNCTAITSPWDSLRGTISDGPPQPGEGVADHLLNHLVIHSRPTGVLATQTISVPPFPSAPLSPQPLPSAGPHPLPSAQSVLG